MSANTLQWIDEKEYRDCRIQDLYEKINPLWSRLQIPQEQINGFIESNLGSGESTIVAVSHIISSHCI